MPGAKKPSGTWYRLVSAGPTTACIMEVWSSAAQSARRMAGLLKGGWVWFCRHHGDEAGAVEHLQVTPRARRSSESWS